MPGPRDVAARAAAHTFTAPVVTFMMRFWNTKKRIATGIVMTTAAPSRIGALEVDGLRVAGAGLSVALAADGSLREARTAAPVALHLH